MPLWISKPGHPSRSATMTDMQQHRRYRPIPLLAALMCGSAGITFILLTLLDKAPMTIDALVLRLGIALVFLIAAAWLGTYSAQQDP